MKVTDPSAPRRFYTVAEAAALMRMSEPTLYRAIRSGEFPAVKVRGRYVVPAKAIDAMESAAVASGLVESAEFAGTPLRAVAGA